jgi:hypothetical protein
MVRVPRVSQRIGDQAKWMSRNQIARLIRVARIETEMKTVCAAENDKVTKGHKKIAAYRG